MNVKTQERLTHSRKLSMLFIVILVPSLVQCCAKLMAEHFFLECSQFIWITCISHFLSMHSIDPFALQCPRSHHDIPTELWTTKYVFVWNVVDPFKSMRIPFFLRFVLCTLYCRHFDCCLLQMDCLLDCFIFQLSHDNCSLCNKWILHFLPSISAMAVKKKKNGAFAHVQWEMCCITRIQPRGMSLFFIMKAIGHLEPWIVQCNRSNSFFIFHNWMQREDETRRVQKKNVLSTNICQICSSFRMHSNEQPSHLIWWSLPIEIWRLNRLRISLICNQKTNKYTDKKYASILNKMIGHFSLPVYISICYWTMITVHVSVSSISRPYSLLG